MYYTYIDIDNIDLYIYRLIKGKKKQFILLKQQIQQDRKKTNKRKQKQNKK